MNESSIKKVLIDKIKDAGKYITEKERIREKVIKKSREILKDSKKSIFYLQSDHSHKAIEIIENNQVKLKKLSEKHSVNELKSITPFLEALQEFYESVIFYTTIQAIKRDNDKTTRKVENQQTKDPEKILNEIFKEEYFDYEEFLKGACDAIGELVRLSVKYSIKNRIEEVIKITEISEEFYYTFLDLTGYTGNLRRKIDSVKWNIDKMQELILNHSKRM